MEQQPPVDSLQVCPIQPHIVAPSKTIKVRQERPCDSDAYLIAAVVQPLEELGVHEVQAVLVDLAPQDQEQLPQRAASDEPRVLLSVFKTCVQLC